MQNEINVTLCCGSGILILQDYNCKVPAKRPRDLRSIILPTKVHIIKFMVFPIVMYGCASWTIKKAERWRVDAFWTAVLEKTIESPLDCKEIKPDNLKGNQSWIFIRRTDAEAKVPIFWPRDANSWLTGKDLDAGKDWRQEKEMTEDEMVGWHHWPNGHEFEQTPRDCEGQGGLACCSSWIAKSWRRLSDWTRTGRYEPWCHAFWNIWELGIFSRDLKKASGSLKVEV